MVSSGIFHRGMPSIMGLGNISAFLKLIRHERVFLTAQMTNVLTIHDSAIITKRWIA